jgi:hypothetical protein
VVINSDFRFHNYNVLSSVGKESKCVAAKGWLQGWAATLLLCALASMSFLFLIAAKFV